ncbi:tRNA (adenine(37)-N6)-methyltransferase [Nilaparvata lugens]|uniref:tRNA (adenine(37)-N6)-methyltransferase n=1 Tax=Nilaparvata lugens TaxID=108931 RepID=UPI00193D02F4|nr:tRNA (adenine(37)-N6)-methyltransferase [Nilaparvata lugens]
MCEVVAESMASLQEQLAVARSEISNLRQQLKSLTFSSQKELKRIESLLTSWKCGNCQGASHSNSSNQASSNDEQNETESHNIELQPIGVISSDFSQKRAVPRQSVICVQMQGKVTINNTVFTNPEHSLEGLDGFSHMWILYHFHRNDSNHVKAKVSPPRLDGARTGVFSTRSPHRPCPIGLSLVHINRIQGRCIYFSGVDMVDGTPVLDLKPYIPYYDNPIYLMRTSATNAGAALVESPPPPDQGVREAPDGEECEEASPLPLNTDTPSPPHVVRVPSWITDPPVSQLNVTFSEQAEEKLNCTTREIVASILREDPRSVYLRERYGNQFYTFLIQDLHVSCKFDNALHSVNVYRIAEADRKCSCGVLEWQCNEHNSLV